MAPTCPLVRPSPFACLERNDAIGIYGRQSRGRQRAGIVRGVVSRDNRHMESKSSSRQTALPSRVGLSVSIPAARLRLIGLRIPAYDKNRTSPLTAAWDWLEATMADFTMPLRSCWAI